MFERFTDRARKVMGVARQHAQEFNHQYIGTEHILLGIMSEGSGVGANVLRTFDINLGKLMEATKAVLQEGPTMVTMGQLPFTPRAKLLLEESSAAAQDLKHSYIGTEHLLIGAAKTAEESSVGKIFAHLQVSASAVVREVYEVCGAVLDADGNRPAGNSDEEIRINHDEDIELAKACFTFDDYQKFIMTLAIYPGAGTGSFEAVTYTALKGAGEAGEYAEKLGKRMRKKGTIGSISRDAMDDEFKLDLAKELGDRLWYVAGAAKEIGFSLSDIARINIEKLTDRKLRGVIDGEGDNR